MDTITRLAVGTLALAAVATIGGALAPVGTGIVPASATTLRPFDDCEELRDWYVEHTVDQVGPYGWGGRIWTTAQVAPEAAAPSAERSGSSAPDAGVANSESGTNVQEAGVDEPDVAKTDGRLVVRIVDGRRVVITDVTGSEPRELGSGTLPETEDAQSLLLVRDHVLVATSGMVALDGAVSTGRPGPGPVGTRVVDLDISDPSDPRVVSDTTWSGRQLALRSYDGVVRLVTSDGLPELGFVEPGRLTEEQATARNREMVRSSRIEDWLPVLRTDDGARRALDCRDVQHPREWAGPDTVTVASFRPGAADQPETVAVTGAGHDVYSSTDRLYVYGDAASRPMPLATERMLPPSSPKTQVHAFDLDGLTVRHTASGTIRGHVRDRWSLDEHGEHLRVAVSWADGKGPRDNGIVVLAEQDGRLVPVGRLRGLGVDEEIKSVRWFDDLAVVVTFRQVDPLYTLDLSEPSRPRVLGELKIPGFSSYLHPIGDDRLLGLGTDADLGGRVVGAQAAVFDISDPGASRQLATKGLGPDSHLSAGDDPHAFTWLPEQDTAVTSLQRWDESGGASTMLVLRVQPDGSLLSREIAGPGDWAPRALPLEEGRVVLVGDDVRLVDLAR